MDVTVDQLWEALKQVCGSNPDKSKIKSLVVVRREHIKAAMAIVKEKK
ncbi:hypothetical protein [Bradyrhizobium sp. SZCCHNRI3052]|nr:hypothetical protein [Bradyrhizobium sp. SZCCHNRI3052]